MALTTMTTSSQRNSAVELLLNLDTEQLQVGDQSVRLGRKAFALVGLLVLARLLERETSSLGWVESERIATLPEWISDRSTTSLGSQIRREIKRLMNQGIDIIDARDGLLKGPFRLRIFPTRNFYDRDRLSKRFGFGTPTMAQTPDDVFHWLEESEPVWRSAHYFDKPGDVIADALDIPEPDFEKEPVVAILALIHRARRLRELGNFKAARQSLKKALGAVTQIDQTSPVRSYLEASCYLHEGWLKYRWSVHSRPSTAENSMVEVARSLEVAHESLHGHAHLRVRAQLLSLRSIVRRRQKRYADALQDLRLAAEFWFVEGDLYNLFSVYHNLSTLVEEQAGDEEDFARRRDLLKKAITYCIKSDTYCRRYGIGQNSAVSALHLVSLYTRIGDFEGAMKYAELAFSDATEKENYREASLANALRVRLLLWRKDYRAAETVHSEFLTHLTDQSLRDALETTYQNMLEQAQREPGCLPSISGWT